MFDFVLNLPEIFTCFIGSKKRKQEKYDLSYINQLTGTPKDKLKLILRYIMTENDCNICSISLLNERFDLQVYISFGIDNLKSKHVDMKVVPLFNGRVLEGILMYGNSDNGLVDSNIANIVPVIETFLAEDVKETVSIK